jgi:hypothetical protein
MKLPNGAALLLAMSRVPLCSCSMVCVSLPSCPLGKISTLHRTTGDLAQPGGHILHSGMDRMGSWQGVRHLQLTNIHSRAIITGSQKRKDKGGNHKADKDSE